MTRTRSSSIILFITILSMLLLGGYFALPRMQAPADSPRNTATSAQPPEVTEPPTEKPLPQLLDALDSDRMIAHVTVLASKIGVRRSGTPAEGRAAQYVQSKLEGYGYSARVSEPIRMHNGRSTRNVVAELPGKSTQVLLIGAHYDSKAPSPGANDNASGVAVLLELAWLLRGTTPAHTIWFVAFGGEEMIDRNREHHHYGSRALAADAALRDRLYAMTSLDMVGVGTALHIDYLAEKANPWCEKLVACADEQDLPVRSAQGKPWSDHEAFARYGIPVAYLHWERDSAYHTTRDRAERVQPARLRQTAEVVLRALYTNSQ